MHIILSSLFILASVVVVGCGGDSFHEDSAGSGGSGGGSESGGAGNAQGGAGSPAGGAGGLAGAAGISGASGGGASGQGGASAAGQGGNAGGKGGHSGNETAGAAGLGGAAGMGGCNPGAFSCFGDLLRQCNASGQWDKKDACGTGLCDEKQGKCLACHPGDVKGCTKDSTKNQDVCTLDGAGFESVACAVSAPFCVEGACVACLAPSDCPTPSNTCLEAACHQNICSTEAVAEGSSLPVSQQVASDCSTLICDGKGSSKASPDNTDLPVDDDPTDCTLVGCSNGAPSTSFATLGTACSLNGMPAKGVCLGDSTCGQCLPGTKTCHGDTLETCPSGSFVETKCDPATPVCSVDACVSVTHLAAGRNHTCALLSNGRVTCWGANNATQLGTDSPDNDNKTHEVTGLVDATAIAAGGENTCAIRQNGKVVCWGSNSKGQLGGGDMAPIASASPVEVKGVDMATAIAVGSEFACAVAGSSREVFCWGTNKLRQLGTTTTDQSSSAIKTSPGVATVKQVVAGQNHACALTDDGNVFCWGDNSVFQLGVNGQFPSQPAQVQLLGVASIGAGAQHTCAAVNGAITCWGANDKGQLGLGKKSANEKPSVVVAFGSLASPSVVGGGAFTCVLDQGKVRSVGDNSATELGGGAKYAGQDPVLTPVEVTDGGSLASPPMTAVSEVVAGNEHACVLKITGDVLCWGNNLNGQLGVKLMGSTMVGYAKPVTWSL